MFPQLIAGPIVRYKDIEKQINDRTVNFEKFNSGIKRFMIGFSKKMILANTCGLIADKAFALEAVDLNTPTAWIGALCYTLQIFFDFSAYSDMAIGIGKILGFDFKENFNYPYISKNIREFWRRWHISLSTWFRDYLYIPLGGNRTGHTYRNLLIVFLICGFWHGASWTFVIWGLYHGIFLIVERTRFGKFIDRLPVALQRIYTLLVVIIGWVLFRADSFGYAVEYLKNMFNVNISAVSSSVLPSLNSITIATIILAVVLSVPVLDLINSKEENSKAKKAVKVITDIIIMAGFILSIIKLAQATYNPFIYFR